MPATLPAERRNDASPIFSPTMFYKLIPNTYSKFSLSAGNGQGLGDSSVNLTTVGSRSSENWQIFYQSGRYFIRNYDYGSKKQLGLTEQNSESPRMYIRNGKLEQQWTIQTIDGGYQLVNGLTGNGTSFNMPTGFVLPAMRSEAGGESWNITSNPEAVTSKALTGDWVSEVEGFQLPSPSPSASASASVSTAAISTATPSFTASSLTIPTDSIGSPLPGSSHLSPQVSSGLGAGAITGIVVGAVVCLSTVALALWFLRFRRRRNAPYSAHEVHGEPRVVVEKYAYNRAELAVTPAELSGAKEESVVNRAELESRHARTPEEKK